MDQVRILLSDGSIVILPKRLVAMSLFNDWLYENDVQCKKIIIDSAFANGDAVEIIATRIAKKME